MKRFTLTLVAVMLTVLSFAQNKERMRTIAKAVDKSELVARKSAECRVEIVKDSPALSAKAYAKAPAIVTDTPEGTLKTYNRSGYAYDYDSATEEFVVAEQSGTAKIVYADDGTTVYLQDPIYAAEFGAWVKGTLSSDGGTITLPLGQYIYYNSDYECGLFLGMVDVTNNNGIEATFDDDESVTNVTYTVDGNTISLNGTSASRALAAVWDDDSLMYRSNYGTVYEEYTFEEPDKVTPPEGLETTTCTWVGRAYLSGYSTISYNVEIGFVDEDVYLKGFDRTLPDAWIAGQLDTDAGEIIFPASQYLGLDSDSNPHYLVGTEDLSNPEDLIYKYKVNADGKIILTQKTGYYSITYNDDAVANSFEYLGYGSGMHNLEAKTAPAGLNTTLYTMTYQHMGGTTSSATGTESKINVEFGILDGKAYLKGVDAAANTKGWLVGTVNGNKIVFDAPQLFDAAGVAAFLAYDRATGEMVDQIEFDYNSTTKYLTQSDSYAIVVNSQLIGGLYYYELMEQAVTGAFEEPEKVIPPTGLETVDAFLASSRYDSGTRTTAALANVKVGIVDEDVYIQGFDIKLPENWIKGTLDETAGTVTFEVQYIGMDEEQNMHYLAGSSGSDITNLTFSYKTTTDGKFIMVLTNPQFYLINKSETSFSFVYYGYNAAIHNLAPVTEKPDGLETDIYTLKYQVPTINSTTGAITSYTDKTKNVVFGILNGKAYIKGLANAFSDVWVVGTVDGAQITFDTPQALDAEGEGILLANDVTNNAFLDKVVFNYDENSKLISQVGDDVIVVNSELLNSRYYYEMLAHCETEAFADEVVTPPAGLETTRYYFEGRKYSSSGASLARQYITMGINGEDAYIKGLFAEVPEGWVKGTVDETNGTLTIPSNQYLGLVDDVTRYIVGYGDGAIGDIVYTKSPQGIYRTTTYVIPTTAKSTTVYNGYYYTASAIAPALPASVTAPDGLETQDFTLTATSGITGEQTVKVGFSGDDVYFQGLYADTNYVNAWVKGTKNAEGKYVFTTPQRLGNYFTYFSGYNTSGLVDEVTFSYDETTNTFTAEGNYCINTNIAIRNAYQSVEGAKLVGPDPSSTGISDIKVENAKDNVWYNINGVRIAQPTQKGIYIQNGKKIAVK